MHLEYLSLEIINRIRKPKHITSYIVVFLNTHICFLLNAIISQLSPI